MNFEEILPLLKGGGVVTRAAWGDNMVIIKQNTNTVYPDIVPNMKSLPDDAKRMFRERYMEHITYTNQVIKLDTVSGMAKNYIPDWEDIFAGDWKPIVLRERDGGLF